MEKKKHETRAFRTYECKTCGHTQQSNKPEREKFCGKCMKKTAQKLVTKK